MLSGMARRHVARALLAALILVALVAPCAARIVSAAMPSHHADADCTTRLCDLPTGCSAPTVAMSAVVPVALVAFVETGDTALPAERLRPASLTGAPPGAPVQPLAARSPPLV